MNLNHGQSDIPCNKVTFERDRNEPHPIKGPYRGYDSLNLSSPRHPNSALFTSSHRSPSPGWYLWSWHDSTHSHPSIHPGGVVRWTWHVIGAVDGVHDGRMRGHWLGHRHTNPCHLRHGVVVVLAGPQKNWDQPKNNPTRLNSWKNWKIFEIIAGYLSTV